MNHLYLFCTECLNTHKENIIFCVWAEHLSQWLRRVNFAFQKINGIAVYILLHRCKITFFVCNSFQCTNYPSALTNKAGQPFFFSSLFVQYLSVNQSSSMGWWALFCFEYTGKSWKAALSALIRTKSFYIRSHHASQNTQYFIDTILVLSSK